jgi:hypothetical protein
VGDALGKLLGETEGEPLGEPLGDSLWDSLGLPVGELLGADHGTHRWGIHSELHSAMRFCGLEVLGILKLPEGCHCKMTVTVTGRSVGMVGRMTWRRLEK